MVTVWDLALGQSHLGSFNELLWACGEVEGVLAQLAWPGGGADSAHNSLP